MAKVRDFSRLALLTLFVALIPVLCFGQFPEQNVNMVSGTQWPGGDPFLRQQNEPSIAVSTRNPLHLLAAANDYRSVDIPFNAPSRPDEEDTGDAWIGVFKSKDGGNMWWSNLLDGYPQLTNSTSPLKGFQAGADPVVRAGNNGMFYLTGIVLNRGDNPLGGVFMARFIDSNKTEVGDPIEYVDTKLIDKGTSGQFIDKPWLFVAPNPNGGQCTVNGQTFDAQNIYLAYSVFVGNDNNIRTKVMFTKSSDCGATWAMPIKLSETYTINQGAAIAVDGSSGVYVFWRRFQGGNDPDSIIMAKSTNGGGSFTKGTVVTNIAPFGQGTGAAAIRTNAYPTAAVDNVGRVHVAWSQRDANDDGRIMLITSTDGGTTWSTPRQVDTSTDRGHQFMPSMIFSAGKLSIAWYDLRLDHTVGTYTKSMTYPGFYDQSRVLVGNLALGQPEVVFWKFLADASPTANSPKLVRRHTLDVRVAEGDPAAPMFSFKSVRASRYKIGSASNKSPIQDLQINPPNLPMFRQGTVPFIGDYIDITAYQKTVSGSAPVSSVPSRVRHVVWTDDRDVRPPLGTPPDWTKYTPVHSPALGQTSIFDPTQHPPDCTTDQFGNAQFAASRNQNIYTTRVTDGLFAGSPGNAKPLGKIKRAFTVFVQNARNTSAAYRLTIAQQPSGGSASFLQFELLDHLDVTIPPHSTATRTVFVTGAAHTRVDVNVREINIAGAGGMEVPGGLSTQVSLNQDPGNPDIGNTDPNNPDIGNAEVFNPDIGNPDIGNPDIGNPDIGNPDIGNPDIGNPDIGNPDIGNADLQNGSASDTNWPAKNQGNTTGGFTVKLLKNADLPAGVKSQLILNKIYDTPVARGCNLGVEHNRQVVANINNPTFSSVADLLGLTNSGLTDSSEKNATMWLAPGETGRITVRLVDPVHKGVTLDASAFVTPVVVAQSVNTQDAGTEGGSPSISLTITTNSLPGGMVGEAYSAPLDAIGGRGSRTWTATGLPAGLTVSGASISGTSQTDGTFSVTITVTDQATPTPHTKSKTLSLTIIPAFRITNTSLPDGTVGQSYSATINTVGGVAPRLVTVAPPLADFGLSLDGATGAITGFPSGVSDQSFTFTVTDSSRVARSASKALAIHVRQPLVITTQTIPDATVNQAYSTTINVTGGQPPFTWTVKGPQELSIDQNGVLSGTFTAPNGSFVTVTVTDAAQPAARFAQQQYNLNAFFPLTILSVTPSTAAAGIGQFVSLDVRQVPSLTGLRASFRDATHTADGFIFLGASTTTRLFVRLPFVGDGHTQSPLENGQIFVHLQNDSTNGPEVTMTQAFTPGTPTIRFVLPTQRPIEGCDFVSSSTPITQITPGVPIGVSAFGVDTALAVLRYTQNNQFVDVFSQCNNSSGDIGVAPIFNVPQFADGDITIQIRTSVNEQNSAFSEAVHLTVKNPT